MMKMAIKWGQLVVGTDQREQLDIGVGEVGEKGSEIVVGTAWFDDVCCHVPASRLERCRFKSALGDGLPREAYQGRSVGGEMAECAQNAGSHSSCARMCDSLCGWRVVP